MNIFMRWIHFVTWIVDMLWLHERSMYECYCFLRWWRIAVVEIVCWIMFQKTTIYCRVVCMVQWYSVRGISDWWCLHEWMLQWYRLDGTAIDVWLHGIHQIVKRWTYCLVITASLAVNAWLGDIPQMVRCHVTPVRFIDIQQVVLLHRHEVMYWC